MAIESIDATGASEDFFADGERIFFQKLEAVLNPQTIDRRWGLAEIQHARKRMLSDPDKQLGFPLHLDGLSYPFDIFATDELLLALVYAEAIEGKNIRYRGIAHLKGEDSSHSVAIETAQRDFWLQLCLEKMCAKIIEGDERLNLGDSPYASFYAALLYKALEQIETQYRGRKLSKKNP